MLAKKSNKKLERKNSRESCFGAKFMRILLYVLPASLFFSYYPVISFGGNEAMNFEISLPIIWLVIFDIVAFFVMMRRRTLLIGLKQKWVWALFPLFLTLSIVWSLNAVRGVLTVGILWLLYFAVYAMASFRENFDREFGTKWVKWLLISSLVACGWCVVQCILDLSGVARECSLMCEGCTYRMFGFPHPNGFAIEPQFMGNLFLAPAIICACLLINNQNSKNLKRLRSRGVVSTTAKSDSARYCSTGSSSVAVVETTTGSLFLCFRFLLFCFFAITATLFLTFSRGAIYAFIVAMIFMSAFLVFREKKNRKVISKRIAIVWGAMVLSFLFTLNLQGIMAEVSPTDDTYRSGVAKVMNHLSLGIIDMREEKVIDLPVENLVENFEDNREEKAYFDGYVAESTDTRVRLNDSAIKVWSKDVKTVFLGVGLGGAGQALFDNGLSPAPKEIVQNEYISLLLETGLVGVSLLILSIVLLFGVAIRSSASGLILTLLVAYGITLCFFSGLPNALHIYLLPMLTIMLFEKDKCML